MSQLGLFYGEKLKQHGLAAIEIKEGNFVGNARAIATLLAKKNGKVTMDDVREITDELGLAPESSNAWGSVFQHGGFKYVGMCKSRRPSNHARLVRIWSLDGPEKLTCQPPKVKKWPDNEYYLPGRA